MAMKKRLKSAREVLAMQLEDPEFRSHWERTTMARAIALWLVRYRAEHNLTQTDLADMLSVSQPRIVQLESGEHDPDLVTLLKLADLLGIRIHLEITPAARGGLQVKESIELSKVVEDVTTAGGSRLLVAAG